MLSNAEQARIRENKQIILTNQLVIRAGISFDNLLMLVLAIPLNQEKHEVILSGYNLNESPMTVTEYNRGTFLDCEDDFYKRCTYNHATIIDVAFSRSYYERYVLTK